MQEIGITAASKRAARQPRVMQQHRVMQQQRVMPQPKAKPLAKAMKDREHRQGRKFKCEVDTNVMSIKLNTLKEEADYATGDPVVCSGCSAVFNINSKLEPNPEGDQLWTCEF